MLCVKIFQNTCIKKNYKHNNISTGFCAIKCWTNRIEENVFGLTQSIHNIHEAFGFKEIYDKLIKNFRHMSLFSVCLLFLRCRRSCEKKSGYCKMCWRVRENSFCDYKAFLSLKVSRINNYLDISSSERVDLGVFLNRPAFFPHCFCEPPRSCIDHQVISFAQDLFAAFCSVLVRMYLNITIDHFLETMLDLSLVDDF